MFQSHIPHFYLVMLGLLSDLPYIFFSYGIVLTFLFLISLWEKCWNWFFSSAMLLLPFTYDTRTCAIQSLKHNNDTRFERHITALFLIWIVSSVVFVFASWDMENIQGLVFFSSEIMNMRFISDVFDQWDYRIHKHKRIKQYIGILKQEQLLKKPKDIEVQRHELCNMCNTWSRLWHLSLERPLSFLYVFICFRYRIFWRKGCQNAISDLSVD